MRGIWHAVQGRANWNKWRGDRTGFGRVPPLHKKEKVKDENSGVSEIDSLKVEMGWLLKVKYGDGEVRQQKTEHMKGAKEKH